MATEATNHARRVLGWAARDATGKLTPFMFTRRENGVNDVTIKIMYCGMCRTDVHFAKNDWENTTYPIVPGYEIVGIITKTGSNVSNFKIGDRVGLGYVFSSCLDCELCNTSRENYCDQMRPVYNSVASDGTVTYGGYSKMIVADHRYCVHIPEKLPLERTAPLLGAGITVYCAMKNSNIFDYPGKRIGVIGLGGLGHMAVKFGKAFGHQVTVISTSPSKKELAIQRLGADDFILSTDPTKMQGNRRSLDFILDTVSANHSIGPYIELLKVDGTLAIVGEPSKPIDFPSTPLIYGKRTIKGSIIGSVEEIEEMMEFCGKYEVLPDIEIVPIKKINEAFDRLAKNDVKFRFVLDIAGYGGYQASRL
ncbi:probable cinnamyl alcohol dehydrogenase 6 [Ipomoea triloba]|uniref:probable cinnamyl alcohol dehydrogenase 6 n=1 Tax=Ipomoea triloba TaxID=35885 RepID=UPI00125DE2DE|nr:probable cinnamyl alcohol dehydrogenase 6 [Ipomoea triloba]